MLELLLEGGRRYGKTLSIYKLMLLGLDTGDDYGYVFTTDIDKVKKVVKTLTDKNVIFEPITTREGIYKVYYDDDKGTKGA